MHSFAFSQYSGRILLFLSIIFNLLTNMPSNLWILFDSLCAQISDKFLPEEKNLDESLQLMIEVLPLCHFSAKRHRLDCLYFLIVHVSKVNLNSFFFFF